MAKGAAVHGVGAALHGGKFIPHQLGRVHVAAGLNAQGVEQLAALLAQRLQAVLHRRAGTADGVHAPGQPAGGKGGLHFVSLLQPGDVPAAVAETLQQAAHVHGLTRGGKQVGGKKGGEGKGCGQSGGGGEHGHPSAHHRVDHTDHQQRERAPAQGGRQADVAVQVEAVHAVVPVAHMKGAFEEGTGDVFQQCGAGHAHQKDEDGVCGHRQGEQQDRNGAGAVDGKKRPVQKAPVHPPLFTKGDIAGFPDPAQERIQEEKQRLLRRGVAKPGHKIPFLLMCRGVQGMGVHDDDFIEHLVTTSTHDRLLFFTNLGKVYSMKGYEIPEYGRSAKGIPVINLLNIDAGEKIATVINIPHDNDDQAKYLFFTTKEGTVKRTPVEDFENIRKNGLKAINLHDGDELINVSLTDGNQNMIIGTHLGYAVSFNENTVRSMGRSAAGVRGIRLRENDYVIGSDILVPGSDVFVISEKGYGKRTPVSEYPIKGRGGKGIKTSNITEKNGPLAGLTIVNGDEDIMVITNKGVLIRFNVADVSQTGRSTLGVHLINLEDDSTVSTIAKVDPEPKDDEEQSDEETHADADASTDGENEHDLMKHGVQDLADRELAHQENEEQDK